MVLNRQLINGATHALSSSLTGLPVAGRHDLRDQHVPVPAHQERLHEPRRQVWSIVGC